MIVTLENLNDLAWSKMDNLIPAIVQDEATGAVLMQGYMNQAALKATLSCTKATFLVAQNSDYGKRRDIRKYFKR